MERIKQVKRFNIVKLLVLLIFSILVATSAFAAEEVTIMDIQGEGHISPYVGQEVTTTGVVTAIAFNGFYMQDPVGDGNNSTSDGIFIFDFRDQVETGDLVRVTDTVEEFIPGGAGTGNLSTTELTFPFIEIISGGNALPDPVIIGKDGRIPPAVDVISEDEIISPINLQLASDDASNTYDPDNDGIDFYESLEGMRVTVQDPVAVSATRTFSPFSSELFTLVNKGKFVEPGDARTQRGGINLQPDPDNRGDQNPERVQIQFDGTLFPFPVPEIQVGDFMGDVTGVVGYSFGNFEVNATDTFRVQSRNLRVEKTNLEGNRKNKLTVATYNVLNLGPDQSDDNQRQTLATHIVDNLRSPDIIALQEIQDNSGETDDGTIDADETLDALVNEIVAVGGPVYQHFNVNPVDGTSGGVPGGNIRNAFLYNPDTVSPDEFISLTPDVLSSAGVSNPGAFSGTRNPLLGKFGFNGEELIIINNHLTSRFGSTPIFGAPQPFVQAGESDREAQVLALNEFVNFIINDGGGLVSPGGDIPNIMVVGDLNTFEFTDDLTEILPFSGDDQILFNLVDKIVGDNIYTFNFEGNSQVLDHVFVSEPLFKKAKADIVHVNVDYPRVDDTVGSDHEPIVVRIELK